MSTKIKSSIENSLEGSNLLQEGLSIMSELDLHETANAPFIISYFKNRSRHCL